MGLGAYAGPASRRDRMTIAQRFNAGNTAIDPQVLEGRPKGPAVCSPLGSAVPAGLAPLFASNPALKRWAIIRCPSGTGAGKLIRVYSCPFVVFQPEHF